MVNKEEAEEIFGWIQASARYAFNKSHSVSYAVCSYWSAYQKAHNTNEFFLAYLFYANEKQDPQQEVYELVSEAKLFDIETRTPSLANFDLDFNSKRNKIYFGIKNVKSLSGVSGDKVFQAVKQCEKESGKKIREFNWLEILLKFSTKISSTESFKSLGW